MDKRLAEALRLAQLGLAVHLLYPRSKEPIAERWQQAPALDVELLRALYRPGMEIGIHTGRVAHARVPVVVLDLDFRSGRDRALSLPDSRPCAHGRAAASTGTSAILGIPVDTRHKPGCLASTGRQGAPMWSPALGPPRDSSTNGSMLPHRPASLAAITRLVCRMVPASCAARRQPRRYKPRAEAWRAHAAQLDVGGSL